MNVHLAKAADLQFQQEINKELAAYIKGQKGVITVHYVDLTTNESYSYNGNNAASAASTLKLPQALYIMELADLG
nr:serine hydrolase [Cytobacillus depressus]